MDGQTPIPNQETTAVEEAPTAPDESITPGNIRALPAWAQSMIRDLRGESAGRRGEIKRLKEEAAQIDEARAAERAELDALRSERDALKPGADRAAALDAYLSETVERRIAALPDAYRGLVPHYADPLEKLRWLDANNALLSSPRSPNLDAGARGTSGGARLNPAEREIAAKLGITPEQYARARK